MILDEISPILPRLDLERGLGDSLGSTPDSNPEDPALVAELAGFYQALRDARRSQSLLYQPGGEWAVYISHRQSFYAALESGDVSAAAPWLRNFWRNPLGAIVKQYATYDKLIADPDARQRFVEWIARDYVIWSSLLHQPIEDLEIPRIGNPWGCFLDDVLIAPKAFRYHILATQIREITRDVPRPVIAEIGAGYGGAAYYLLRGKTPMVYLDFDLPETLVLAAYHLRRALPHRRIHLCSDVAEINPDLLARYDVILAPNWGLQALPDSSVDLFLNTFSLSEMPLPTISEYLQHVERACRGYFLHNNVDRAGVVNAGAERVPLSRFPIAPDAFKLLYKRYDLFQDRHHGRDGDYREVLYQRLRIPSNAP